jgi:hypothetical protein
MCDGDLKWYTVRREFVEGPCVFLFGVGVVLILAVRVMS